LKQFVALVTSIVMEGVHSATAFLETIPGFVVKYYGVCRRG
jgi:hypothetical protein